MSYSVVVVTWRSRAHLERLVGSMNRHLASDPELVVVENASGEDPEAAARRWRGPLELIREARNVGFGAASNDGVERASGDSIVLLNPDTELVDSGLDRLVATADELGGIAGPRLLNADGSIQPSASGPPVGVWPWVRAFVPGRLHPPAVRARTEPWRCERRVRVGWLTGACLAARRDVLIALGPFDPALELYAEDMDLGLRAEAAGVGSWFCPDACRLVHHGSASAELRFANGEELAVQARNRVAVLRRAYGSRRERRASLAERLYLTLRGAAKRALGDSDADRLAAIRAAARAARSTPALGPAPGPGPRRARR
jgi:GT2 family glycosyltransferase